MEAEDESEDLTPDFAEIRERLLNEAWDHDRQLGPLSVDFVRKLNKLETDYWKTALDGLRRIEAFWGCGLRGSAVAPPTRFWG